MVDDLVLALFLECLSDPSADLLERLIPADRLELPRPTRALALERRKDALGIGDLIDRRRALGAGAAAAPRVHRVALELRDVAGLLVHVRDEPTGALAVEADRRHEPVVDRFALGPGSRIELTPVIPLGGIGGHRELPGSVALGLILNGHGGSRDERASALARESSPVPRRRMKKVGEPHRKSDPRRTPSKSRARRVGNVPETSAPEPALRTGRVRTRRQR